MWAGGGVLPWGWELADSLPGGVLGGGPCRGVTLGRRLAEGGALVKGYGEAWAVAKNAARQGLRQFLPGRQSDND